MKIKKTIEIVKTVCDICGDGEDQISMFQCSKCGIDMCKDHTYLITNLEESKNFGYLCERCFAKLKTSNDDCPSEHWLFGGEE